MYTIQAENITVNLTVIIDSQIVETTDMRVCTPSNTKNPSFTYDNLIGTIRAIVKILMTMIIA